MIQRQVVMDSPRLRAMIRHSTLLLRELRTSLAVRGIVMHAVVAGGCLRDAAYDMDPKDVDVFISENNSPGFYPALEEVFGSIKWFGGRALYWSDGRCVRVGTAERTLLNTPVNIIVTPADRHLENSARGHDFGICGMWVDEYGMFNATPAAVADFRNHWFTLVNCQSEKDFGRSMRRWDRFAQRFPTHKLRIAPHLTSLAHRWATLNTEDSVAWLEEHLLPSSSPLALPYR